MTWQHHERAYLPAVQCLAFDGYSELLWAGSANGHVSSHFTAKEYGFSRYSSYRGHIPGPVQEISIDERGILSVGGSVKLANRRGIAAWNA
jgi:PAB-dependent poly(A)-specific ribonuclease subunit 2